MLGPLTLSGTDSPNSSHFNCGNNPSEIQHEYMERIELQKIPCFFQPANFGEKILIHWLRLMLRICSSDDWKIVVTGLSYVTKTHELVSGVSWSNHQSSRVGWYTMGVSNASNFYVLRTIKTMADSWIRWFWRELYVLVLIWCFSWNFNN